jgi:(2R)-3-sulfolactate dehydrogenase (NADP+)
LRRLPSYGAQAASGKVDGHAVAVAERRRPGVLTVDAANGFAYPALGLALEALPVMAREQGVAVAGVRRSHHAGVTGLFVEELARQGLVAMMLVNTPGAIAPWGGAQALFGTNPIAFAAPVPGAEPIVIDLSRTEGRADPGGLGAGRRGQPDHRCRRRTGRHHGADGRRQGRGAGADGGTAGRRGDRGELRL